MNLRALLAAAAVLVPAGTSYAQDACDAATFEQTCPSATEVQFCNAQAVTETFDCAQVGAECGERGCTGPSALCTDGVLSNDCVAPLGGACFGAAALLNEDTTDDQQAFGLGCTGDNTCVTGLNADGTALEETCTARVGPACTAGADLECVDNMLVICRSFVENEGDTEPSLALTANFAWDCTPFGATCNPNFAFDDGTTGPNCEFPDVGEGEGEGEGGGGGGGGGGGDTGGGGGDTGGGDGTGNTGGEGEGEGDRDDEEEPAPTSINCQLNSFAMVPTFGPLALALLALRRRRR
jgi:uncharacterized membrane protein YgcG